MKKLICLLLTCALLLPLLAFVSAILPDAADKENIYGT